MSATHPGLPHSSFPQADIDELLSGNARDHFRLLGCHRDPLGGWVLRAFQPGAETLTVVCRENGRPLVALDPVHKDGVFAGRMDERPPLYRYTATRGHDQWQAEDCYQFAPVLGDIDEHLLSEGKHLKLWQVLGARVTTHQGVTGTAFGVWAPNAQRVSVVGDFNGWDGRRHVMRTRGATGVHEIFIPGLAAGTRYKYEIKSTDGRLLPLKADPVARQCETPPDTASIVAAPSTFAWRDGDWMTRRGVRHQPDQPISIYEVHLPSWRKSRTDGAPFASYRELAETLVPYAADLGFTHIEVLPISEYPFGGSWGYQPTGLYAPTARHGSPDDFRAFVQACHDASLGLILDWVPGHFPTDAHGLGRFDGTALYEYADPREGFHQDWDTYIYNYARNEVRNFLTANALYLIEAFHIDALRVDAVASMLYRDYSRKAGEWVANVHGGRENLEAIEFLQQMNTLAYGQDSSIMTIAEESTAWPGVSRPVHEGGLGFGFKWNMGWMHDTLEYMKLDPVYRRHNHNLMSFGLQYAFSENFVLPLSHDEVVHGKGSLISRMPGTDAEKFANLRVYYAFMWAHPGKKLLFMGCEFAQRGEWNHDSELDWHALDQPAHAGIQKLIRDLNAAYAARPALHQRDHRADGFQWLQGGAEAESIFTWLRHGNAGTEPVLCAFNFTPVARRNWRVGVPDGGRWTEILNTDAGVYGGENRGNLGGLEAQATPFDGQPYALDIVLPPLSAVFLQRAAR